MSAGENALSMVVAGLPGRGVLVQNAIHQFRQLARSRSKTRSNIVASMSLAA